MHGEVLNYTFLRIPHCIIQLSNLLIFSLASKYSHSTYVCYERIVDVDVSEWTKVSLRVAVADDMTCEHLVMKRTLFRATTGAFFIISLYPGPVPFAVTLARTEFQGMLASVPIRKEMSIVKL